jgi:hypothetical protein
MAVASMTVTLASTPFGNSGYSASNRATGTTIAKPMPSNSTAQPLLNPKTSKPPPAVNVTQASVSVSEF